MDIDDSHACVPGHHLSARNVLTGHTMEQQQSLRLEQIENSSNNNKVAIKKWLKWTSKIECNLKEVQSLLTLQCFGKTHNTHMHANECFETLQWMLQDSGARTDSESENSSICASEERDRETCTVDRWESRNQLHACVRACAAMSYTGLD